MIATTHTHRATLQAALSRQQGHRPCDRRSADDYFPDAGHIDPAYAYDICKGCPVLASCLELALIEDADSHTSEGIYGGTTPEQRRQLIAQRAKATSVQHGPHPEAMWDIHQVLDWLGRQHVQINRGIWHSRVKTGTAPQPHGNAPTMRWRAADVVSWKRQQHPHDAAML